MRTLMACGTSAIARDMFATMARHALLAKPALLEVTLAPNVVVHFARTECMEDARRWIGFEFSNVEFHGFVPEDVQCFLRSRLRPWAVVAAPTASSNATPTQGSPAERAASPPFGDAPALSMSREQMNATEGWVVLRELLGHVEDGSSASVNISQDDATKVWCVRVGKRSYYDAHSLYIALRRAREG